MLWYALGLCVMCSALGALLNVFSFCEKQQEYGCGDFARFDVFVPTVISGCVIILLSFWISRLAQRAWPFFVSVLTLSLMFNSGEGRLEAHYAIVGALPVLVAAVIAWYAVKKHSESLKSHPHEPPYA